MILEFKTLVHKNRTDSGEFLFARLESTKHFPYFNYTASPILNHVSVTMDSYSAMFDNKELTNDLIANHEFRNVTLHINDLII
jgi:hypothetical protein